MTVAELIEALSQLDPTAEVRLATQPNYPMYSRLQGVRPGTDFVEPDDWDDVTAEESEAANAVYLSEGAWVGYGSGDAWA